MCNFTFHKHELVWILLGVVRNQQEMWILAYILCISHAKNDQEILPKIEYILMNSNVSNSQKWPRYEFLRYVSVSSMLGAVWNRQEMWNLAYSLSETPQHHKNVQFVPEWLWIDRVVSLNTRNYFILVYKVYTKTETVIWRFEVFYNVLLQNTVIYKVYTEHI